MRVGGDVAAGDPAEGVRNIAVVEVQPVGLLVVSHDHIQVAVAVHVPQRHRVGIVRVGGDVAAGDPAEGVRGAVVEVQPVGLINITGYQVQVAVAVHVPQRHRVGSVRVGGDVAAGDAGKRAGGAVVEVQPDGLIAVTDNQVQVAVAVGIPQHHRKGIVRIGGDIAAGDPAERVRGAVVEVQPVDLHPIPGYQVQVAVTVHVAQRHRVGIMRVGGDVAAGDTAERVGGAVVQV